MTKISLPLRPRGQRQTIPFDNDEFFTSSRQYQPRSLPDEVSQAARQNNQGKTVGYGSELFTKSEGDPFIQYASFAPISMDAPQHLLNTKKISLQYQVKNAGPSGVKPSRDVALATAANGRNMANRPMPGRRQRSR